MTTPTAPVVLASDGIPAQFRPSNQANLEPAEAANFCPSQGMLPGLGSVRSGSPISNGLVPDNDREVEAYLALAGQVGKRAQQVDREIVTLTAQKQMADQTGDTRMAKKLRKEIAHAKKRREFAKRRQTQAVRAAKAADLPIWRKQAVTVTDTVAPVPMRQVTRMGHRQAIPAGVGNFLTDTSIPFVPNWALLASAGVLSLVLVMKKKR